jgi:Phage capsid family
VKGGSGAVCSAIIFGAWNELLIGIWGGAGLDILVNPYAETPYSKGNIQIRGMMTVDISVRHPASFVKTADVLTT